MKQRLHRAVALKLKLVYYCREEWRYFWADVTVHATPPVLEITDVETQGFKRYVMKDAREHHNHAMTRRDDVVQRQQERLTAAPEIHVRTGKPVC